jgi:mono/diheme cytochrome c family protein
MSTRSRRAALALVLGTALPAGWAYAWDCEIRALKQGQENPRAVPVVQAVDMTPSPYRDLKNPLAGNQAAIAAGKARFETYCTACHGQRADARGAPIRVRGMPIDFNDPQQVSWMTDGYAFWRVKEGAQAELKSQHPAYKQHFSDQQIWEMVAYLQSIEPKGAWAVDWTTARLDPVQNARMTFTAKNCTACHALNGLGGTTGPDLAKAPLQKDEAWRTEHIRKPTITAASFDYVRPREPNAAEVDAIKQFLKHLREQSAAASPPAAGARQN